MEGSLVWKKSYYRSSVIMKGVSLWKKSYYGQILTMEEALV